MNIEGEKLSENVGRFKRGKYTVTCARWDKSYELGIRDSSVLPESKGHFFLIQSDFFNAWNIQQWGACAASMLSFGIAPSDIAGILNQMDSEDKDES
mgnify:CR=1 FL=1